MPLVANATIEPLVDLSVRIQECPGLAYTGPRLKEAGGHLSHGSPGCRNTISAASG